MIITIYKDNLIEFGLVNETDCLHGNLIDIDAPDILIQKWCLKTGCNRNEHGDLVSIDDFIRYFSMPDDFDGFCVEMRWAPKKWRE